MADTDLKIRISGDASSAKAAFDSMNESMRRLSGEWTELNQSMELAKKAIGGTFEILRRGAELLEEGGGLREQRVQFEALAASHGVAADRMIANIKRISDQNATLSESFALGSKLAKTGLGESDQVAVLEYAKKWSEAAGRPFIEVGDQVAKALASGRMTALREMGITAETASGVVEQARRKIKEFADVDFSAADKIGAMGTAWRDFEASIGEALGKSPEIQRALTEMADAAVKFTQEFKYDQSVQPVVKFLDSVYQKAKSVAEGLGLIVDGLGSIDKAAGGTGGGGAVLGTAAAGAIGAGGTALAISGYQRLAAYAATSAAAAEAAKLAAANSAEFAATRAVAALPAGASPALANAVAAFSAPAPAAGGSVIGGAATWLSSAVAAILSSPVVLTAMIAAVGYLIYEGSGDKTKPVVEPTVGKIPQEWLDDINKKLGSPIVGEPKALTEEQQDEAEKRYKRFLDDQKTALRSSLEDQEYERKKHNDKVLDGFKDRIEKENAEYKKQTEILKRQQEDRQRELEKTQAKQRTDFERFQAFEAEQFKKTGNAATGSTESRLDAFIRQDREKYRGPITSFDSEEIRAEKFKRQQEAEKLAFGERQEQEKRALESSIRAAEQSREKLRESNVKQIEEERDTKRLQFEEQSRIDKKYIDDQVKRFDRSSQDAMEAAKKDGFQNLYLPPGVKAAPGGALSLEQLPGTAGGSVALPAENALLEILAALRAGVIVTTKGGDRLADEVTDMVIRRAEVRARLEGTAVAAAN